MSRMQVPSSGSLRAEGAAPRAEPSPAADARVQHLPGAGFDSASARLVPRGGEGARDPRGPGALARAPAASAAAVQRSEVGAPPAACAARHVARERAVPRTDQGGGDNGAPAAPAAAGPDFRVPMRLRLGNVRAALETMRDQKRDETDYNTARAICTDQVRAFREGAMTKPPAALLADLIDKGVLKADDRVYMRPDSLPEIVPG